MELLELVLRGEICSLAGVSDRRFLDWSFAIGLRKLCSDGLNDGAQNYTTTGRRRQLEILPFQSDLSLLSA
jgi:hypothetical protein